MGLFTDRSHPWPLAVVHSEGVVVSPSSPTTSSAVSTATATATTPTTRHGAGTTSKTTTTTTTSTTPTNASASPLSSTVVPATMDFSQKPRAHDTPDPAPPSATWTGGPPGVSYELNVPQTLFLTLTPILSVVGMATVPLTRWTGVWALVYYVITALGITAGYHRMFAHRSYDAGVVYRTWMLLAGAGAMEGSARWWSRGHRAHHRFTDTELDPYSAHRGLFWSHIGWLIFKPSGDKRKALGKVEMQDLDKDPLVRLQHQYYIPLAFFMGFVLPTLVAGLGWGDWLGGYVYAGLVRQVVVHHATFCVNSLAHYLGEQTYDDVRTPRDHFITALVTMGEGYHNFHHEFPNDYRNAIRWYQYDPTKWTIRLCSLFGLTHALKRFPENEVQKGRLLMQEKQIKAWRARLNWGVPFDQLPVWTSEKFHSERLLNPCLVVVEQGVIDVSDFIHDHPGGVGYLKAYLGKDATKAFQGTVYKHSTAANNLLVGMRVARLSEPLKRKPELPPTANLPDASTSVPSTSSSTPSPSSPNHLHQE